MGRLVLTRRRGEGITIGDDIHLTVIDSRNGQVRVGIEAPESYTILRDELVQPKGEAPVEAGGADAEVPEVALPVQRRA